MRRDRCAAGISPQTGAGATRHFVYQRAQGGPGALVRAALVV